MKYNNFIIGLVCVIANVCYCQTKPELIKIVPDDRAEGDCFGWATNIYNDFCVIGTCQRKAKKLTGHRLLQEGGGAYIFKKNAKGIWLQTQLLLPNSPKALDFFGSSVSINDNYLAIGANGDDDATDDNDKADSRMGAVYMYKLDKFGQWNKMQKIILDSRTDRDNFGYEVALYNNKLIVSSINKVFKDSKINGAVYIYEIGASGGWIQKHIIKCPEKDVVFFGQSISVSDSILVIGSMEGNKAFVYKLNKSNQWLLINKLVANDKSDMDFGSSVFVNKNIIGVGALGSYVSRSYYLNLDTIAYRKKHLLGAGAVYIYNIDAKNNIDFKQRITAKDSKADMHFGMCSSVSDSLLVVGAFGDALDDTTLVDNNYGGAAYIFKQNKDGNWIETKKIVSTIRSVWDKFAFSVSVYDKTIIIGSRFEKEDAQEKHPINSAGAAYIYQDK